MMNQKMLENAHRKIIELGEKNAREDIVKLSRNLRSRGFWDPTLVQSELVALLELGQFQCAKNLYRRCNRECDLHQPFEITFCFWS